jgi:predicted O-methyltransferase YrrM
MSNYALRGGVRGAERLRLLASVKWPTTSTLLDRIGLHKGMRCLDVGCGIGAVTLRMAQAVGRGGRVVGLDIDRECLSLASEEARRLGLRVAYDLVFGRFILTHLRQPETALAGMARAVRPAGVVAIEDIQFAGHFCYPPCAAFDRYVALYQQVVQRKGGDPNIGPRLLEILIDAGLEEVTLEVIQPTFCRGEGKQIAAVTMDHIREAVVRAGLGSDEEVTNIVSELESFARGSRSLMALPRVFQVWGKRRGAAC